MITMRCRRFVTAAAVTVGLLGAAAAVPAVVPAVASAADTTSAVATVVTASSTTSSTNALLTAINDARMHPEKYPPRGNTAGAKMGACPAPFRQSAALYKGANAHDKFLAGQPTSWVQTGVNAHRDPNGALAWESNGHIAAAGFNSARAEIVAWGQPTSAAAVRAWMQDDEHSAWGHRNIILDCSLTYAGASNYAGGPAGHYFTADMGNR
jgi:hypothetical protein